MTGWMTQVRRASQATCRRVTLLRTDHAGTILPMAVAGIFILAAVGGGSVDASRIYKTRNRLQYACDAGTLAARRAITTDGLDQDARDKATAYFNANFNAGRNQATGTSFTTTSPDNGNSVVGTASATIPMAVMQIFGYTQFTVDVTCSATMGVGNADVIMVLDTTGSMLKTAANTTPSGTQTSRLEDLQSSMKAFFATLANASAGTNARIRYGFVPYTLTVNVGRLLFDRDPDFLSDSRAIQSRRWSSSTGAPVVTYSSTTEGTKTAYSGPYAKSSECNSAKPANSAWTDDGEPTTGDPVKSSSGYEYYSTTRVTQPQSQTAYTCQSVRSGRNTVYYVYTYTAKRDAYSDTRITSNWIYEQVTYDTSAFKRFESVATNNGSEGATRSYTWDGCIVERATSASSSFSFSTLTGMSPTAADLDIDSAPDPSDASTQWSPLWKEVAYYRTTSGGNLTTNTSSVYGDSAAYGCPHEARTLSTMTQAEFDEYADSLTAYGATYHDIGLTWGARLASPDGIFADIVNDPPDNGGKVSRHIIFMTDGQMDTGNTIDGAWGVEWHDRKVTTDGSKTQSDARHIARFRALCDAVKAKGIRIWMIAFGTTLSTDMSYCASDQSSYTAANTAALNTAFQEIAKQVGELRVYQ